jgi:signal transduction histidine kinase
VVRLDRIKIVAILASSAGIVAFEVFRHFVVHPLESHAGEHLTEHMISGSLLFVAVLAFSLIIFRPLERLHGQLSSLNEASLAMTSELSFQAVLARIADLARSVGRVPFASVEMTDPPAKVSAGERPPSGGATVVPILLKGERAGQLTLVSRNGTKPDTRSETLEIFATQAGVALENARLFEQVQALVASRERNRIGMELHDGVIQHLYALALVLEDTAEVAAAEPSHAVRIMGEMNQRVRAIVDEIRAYVYDLGDGDASVNLAAALRQLVSEFSHASPDISLDIQGNVALPGSSAGDILQIVREAVSNALRHSGAGRIRVSAQTDGHALELAITDDGTGFDVTAPSRGLGLHDMSQRAQRRGAELVVGSSFGEGTSVRLDVPLADRAEARL